MATTNINVLSQQKCTKVLNIWLKKINMQFKLFFLGTGTGYHLVSK